MNAIALAILSIPLYLAADRYDRPREGGIYLRVKYTLWLTFVAAVVGSLAAMGVTYVR